MACVIALPTFDIPTRCATGIMLRHIVPRTEPISLIGGLATKLPFSLALKPSDFVLTTGHGENDIVTGHDEETLLEVGGSEEVEGKFFKLVSCLSGEELGPDLIRRGASGFQGYTGEYLWLVDDAYIRVPWEDPYSKKALMPVVDGLNHLLDGGSNLEAYEIEVEGYKRAIEDEEDELARSFLVHNLNHFICLGDPEARISRRPRIRLPLAPPPFIQPIEAPYDEE